MQGLSVTCHQVKVEALNEIVQEMRTFFKKQNWHVGLF